MEFATLSTPGGRKINEDRLLVQQSANTFLAAVADGLGGHGNGDLAAEQALQVLGQLLADRAPQRNALTDAAAEANRQIMQQCTGKTTLALLWGDKSTALAAHIGDSRIYHFRDAQILYQSQDHSVTQLAVAVGEITEDEIRGHVDRNKLIRAMGSPEGGIPELHPLELSPGDGLLLCTDGFWELILESEMIDTYKNTTTAQSWLTAMEQMVVRRQTPQSDNCSAVVLREERRTP